MEIFAVSVPGYRPSSRRRFRDRVEIPIPNRVERRRTGGFPARNRQSQIRLLAAQDNNFRIGYRSRSARSLGPERVARRGIRWHKGWMDQIHSGVVGIGVKVADLLHRQT